ncbi:hypothetical protein D3C73_1417890 [compost metagenome]
MPMSLNKVSRRVTRGCLPDLLSVLLPPLGGSEFVTSTVSRTGISGAKLMIGCIN